MKEFLKKMWAAAISRPVVALFFTGVGILIALLIFAPAILG